VSPVTAWGFEIVTISSFKVFKGPTAALLAAVFLSVVVVAFSNF